VPKRRTPPVGIRCLRDRHPCADPGAGARRPAKDAIPYQKVNICMHLLGSRGGGEIQKTDNWVVVWVGQLIGSAGCMRGLPRKTGEMRGKIPEN
jgi:hypothetical protein